MVEIIVDKDFRTIMELDDRRVYSDGIFAVATRTLEGKEKDK